MALRQQGEYWYGDGPADVWEYFVRRDRDSPEPVKHWRQAVCRCGHTIFEVDYDEEANYLVRRCFQCDVEVVMFADEFADVPPPPEPVEVFPEGLECICRCAEFEVVGVTAPFHWAPNSAKWFYLGLRCVECGCLGCYADWIPRYNDHEAFLAMI